MQEWKFENGRVKYNKQLKTEILGISRWIEKGIPLQEGQLKLIQSICAALYENDGIKIVRRKGRESGGTVPNLSLCVYEVILRIDCDGLPVGEAVADIADRRTVGIKNLEAAYYEQCREIRRKLNDPEKGKDFRCMMNYAVAAYLK